MIVKRSCLKQLTNSSDFNNNKNSEVEEELSSSTTTSKTTTTTTMKYVAFDKVVLNEFPIILGDNPAVVRRSLPPFLLFVHTIFSLSVLGRSLFLHTIFYVCFLLIQQQTTEFGCTSSNGLE